MCLSDTAEYWWDIRNKPKYNGPIFYHHPNKLCSHYRLQTGNTSTTPYINDINCHECKARIESGEFSKDELKLEDSPPTYYMSHSERKKYNKQKAFNDLHGKCSCGSIWTIRKNKITNQEFLGCINYPKCKNTKKL